MKKYDILKNKENNSNFYFFLKIKNIPLLIKLIHIKYFLFPKSKIFPKIILLCWGYFKIIFFYNDINILFDIVDILFYRK
jgi:hypothetical protein